MTAGSEPPGEGPGTSGRSRDPASGREPGLEPAHAPLARGPPSPKQVCGAAGWPRALSFSLRLPRRPSDTSGGAGRGPGAACPRPYSPHLAQAPATRRSERGGGRCCTHEPAVAAAAAAPTRCPNLPPPPCWRVRSPRRASVTAGVGAGRGRAARGRIRPPERKSGPQRCGGGGPPPAHQLPRRRDPEGPPSPGLLSTWRAALWYRCRRRPRAAEKEADWDGPTTEAGKACGNSCRRSVCVGEPANGASGPGNTGQQHWGSGFRGCGADAGQWERLSASRKARFSTSPARESKGATVSACLTARRRGRRIEGLWAVSLLVGSAGSF